MRVLSRVAFLPLFALFLVACGKQQETGTQPPQVGVVTVHAQSLPVEQG